MSHIIKDGTGKGYQAGVDSDNRLQTKSVSVAETKDASTLGNAYQVTNQNVPVVGSTEQLITYFVHNDPTRNFYINKFYIWWNGGSTNYNRPLQVGFYFGTYEPTAGHVSSPWVNQNFTSGNTAEATQYVWDQTTGTGMTTAYAGVLGQYTFYTQGMSVIDVDGIYIVGKGLSLGITVNAPEAGVYTGITAGWFE